MKKGLWNYTETILYSVVNVRVHRYPDTPMHWQNHVAGEVIQAVRIMTPGGHNFLIDNRDGSGLRKIAAGGGPDSMSRHLDGPFDLLNDVPESEWIQWDPLACFEIDQATDKWQAANFPEEHARILTLRKALADHRKTYRK